MRKTYTTTVLENHHLNDAYNEMSGVAKEHIYDFNFKLWFKVVLGTTCLQSMREILFVSATHERNEYKRRNYRNGFYTRSLQTVLGFIKELKVPRPRYKGYSPLIFKKYEQTTSGP